MQAKFRLKIGQDEFELNFDVKDEKDFFEQVSFYSGLPKAAPNGATDLKIAFRTTKEGHKYYSLVSEKEKMEFRLGQNKENQGGGLFPKGWQPLYEKETDETQQGAPAPAFGSQVQAAPVQQPRHAPAAPVVPFGAQPMPTPQVIAQPVQQPVAAPVQAAPTPTAAPAAVNPQVAQVAGNVLARFGIQNK